MRQRFIAGIISVSFLMIPLSASAAYHYTIPKQTGQEPHLFHIMRTQVVPRVSHRVLVEKVQKTFPRVGSGSSVK